MPRKLAATAAALLLGGGLVALLAFGEDEPLPPTVVSHEALPPLPADNGWQEIAGLEVPESDAFSEACGELATRSETEPAAERWTAMLETRDAFAAAASTSIAQQALAAWQRAAASPAVVPHGGEGHHVFRYYKLSQLALVAATDHAMAGRWTEADRGLADVLRVHRSSWNGARTTLAAMVSASVLQESLHIASLLGDQHGWEGLPRTAQAIDDLDAQLEPLMTVEYQAAIGDYLANRELVAATIRDDTRPWLERRTFDGAHTARLIDAAFLVTAQEHADPLAALGRFGDPPPLEAECGWLARTTYNRLGCDIYEPREALKRKADVSLTLSDDDEGVRRWIRRLVDLRRAAG